MQDYFKGKVLIIDDSESILFLLESILSPFFEVTSFTRAKKAFESFNNKFDLVIVDLMMPEMSGIEFIKLLRKKTEFKHIPIVVLTAKYNTEEEIAKLFDLGVNDYIQKPFLSAELLARIKTHAKMKKLNEELMEANKKLQYIASHDELTKVYNRSAIFNFLENEILRLKRSKTKLVAMMFDIDNFKKLNDTYGHQTGDYVLYRVVSLVKQTVREVDLIGRYGGDEFLIILPHTEIKKAMDIADRILKKINREKFKYNNTSLKVTLSLGLSEILTDDNIDRFIERVDNALYEAKKTGRNCMKIK